MPGGIVAEADLNIISLLQKNFHLDDSMINILLGYSLATKEGRIRSYSFFEKIVLDWKKHKIKTVEDAYYYITKLYKSEKKATNKDGIVSVDDWYKDYWK